MCRFDPGAKVIATWTSRVESYCPSLNTIGVNSKNNHKYRGWRKRWEDQFGPWLKLIPPAAKYRRVTVTRQYGKGKRPFDSAQNFSGGCKPLIDTLTNFGAIYDDSDTWCQSHYLQEKSLDGKDYVEVKIEEIE